jgi:Zn-finger nucleic acid-binding protein
MNCPKCAAAMERVQVETIEVDRCTGCQGIWFDSLEEERLEASGAAAAVDVGKADEAVGDRARVDCPRCHTRMIRMVDVDQPEIAFESCKFCYGRFLDAGEFRQIAGADVGTLLERWRLAGPPPMV